MDYIITAYGPVLLLCVLRKRKTKDMSARLVIIIPSNLLSQYSIFKLCRPFGWGETSFGELILLYVRLG